MYLLRFKNLSKAKLNFLSKDITIPPIIYN